MTSLDILELMIKFLNSLFKVISSALKSLNLIDNEELGKFKLDKIFKEIAIKSNRLYVAKTIDDEVVFHTYKKQVDYETFVNEVKKSV